jgi:hypothetical protein
MLGCGSQHRCEHHPGLSVVGAQLHDVATALAPTLHVCGVGAGLLYYLDRW